MNDQYLLFREALDNEILLMKESIENMEMVQYYYNRALGMIVLADRLDLYPEKHGYPVMLESLQNVYFEMVES